MLYTNVSTPNDFALTYQDAFDNTVTVMVCKFQGSDDLHLGTSDDVWRVRKATEFGGPMNTIYDRLEGCESNCFSGAVANATAYVENALKNAGLLRPKEGKE